MSYKKPSVTVRQVQVTESLPLPDPTFKSCIVGQGYYWQDPFREDEEMNSIASAEYVGAELTINISEFTDHDTVVDGTLIVDLIRRSGPSGTIGEVTSLEITDDFTYDTGVITLSASIAGYTDQDDAAKVRVGFLAERDDLTDQYQEINEMRDITDFIGTPVPWNPLAFGASLAIANSGRSTSVVGVGSAGDFTNAASVLENKDVYAISALTGVSTEAEKLSAHVTNMSLPENKKERIAFASRFVPDYADTNYYENDATSAEKTTVAQSIQTYSAGLGNRRYFQIHPDAGWVESQVHTSTLYSSFISGVFGIDPKPKFLSNVTIGSKRYKAFQNITDAIVDELKAGGITQLRVYYPVPGYYFTAALVGQVSAKEPQAPLTNSAISGFAMTHRSNDYFSPTQLDTIAEGGTWVLEQRAVGSIVTSHQLSTDAVTVETRELSITNQLDNVSMFMRSLVSPLIGTRVISDSFLRTLRATMVGAAEALVERKEIRDVKILDLYQDEIQPDTIKVDMAVLPLYPLNYIKITLQF